MLWGTQTSLKPEVTVGKVTYIKIVFLYIKVKQKPISVFEIFSSQLSISMFASSRVGNLVLAMGIQCKL